MSRWGVVLTCVVFASLAPAYAQDVRESRSGNASSMREMEQAAEKQGLTGFPRFRDGGKGMIVDLYYNYSNQDITIIRNKDVPLVDLLRDAKQFAATIGKPKADFITYEGHTVNWVDVELNDYLPDVEGPRTVEFDIAKIAAAVKAMPSSEEPIWIVVDHDNSDRTILRKSGESDREITEFTFLLVGKDELNVKFLQVAEIKWYAYLVLIALGLLFLSAPVYLVSALIRMPVPPKDPNQLKSPDEVQAEYIRDRKKGWIAFWPLVLMLPFVLLGRNSDALSHAERLIPPGFTTYALAMPLVMIVLLVPLMLWRRKRMKELNHPQPEANAETRSFRLMSMAMMVPLLLGMAVFLLPRLFPGIRAYIPLPLVRALPIILPALMIVPLIVGGLLLRRKNNRTLAADDPYRLFTFETAARAGAKIRTVEEYDVPYVNAMATLGGKVVLTKGLLTKMEPDEIKAVIAHEIGHHRAKHVKTLFGWSLVVIACLMAVHFWIFSTFPNAHPLFSSPIVTMPLAIFVPQMILGKRRRKYEHDADLFAVDVMNDPELVIHSLKKMAHLNQTPTELVGIDEKLSSHPSIANRERTIRAYHESRVDPPSGLP